MKAITLYPEFAWAVCRLGKNVENRPRRMNMELGTELAIHAGMAFGGSSKKYIKIDEVFSPVAIMARRSGWIFEANIAENAIRGYSVKKHNTFSDKVHMMPQGAVVAVAIFAGLLEPGSTSCAVAERDWPWWAGDQYGYILEKVKVLKEPVAVRGKQGLWDLKDPELSRVLSQIRSQ